MAAERRRPPAGRFQRTVDHHHHRIVDHQHQLDDDHGARGHRGADRDLDDGYTTTTTGPANPDEAAALAFIDAWRSGDAEAMRQFAPDEQVDIATAFGTATGEPDCRYQRGGPYQCVVNVSSGTRMYILTEAGRVSWVAEYVPGT